MKARNSDEYAALQAKNIYKMISNLPLLPEENFTAGYKYIHRTATEHKLTKKFDKLFKYFERTWIAEV